MKASNLIECNICRSNTFETSHLVTVEAEYGKDDENKDDECTWTNSLNFESLRHTCLFSVQCNTITHHVILYSEMSTRSCIGSWATLFEFKQWSNKSNNLFKTHTLGSCSHWTKYLAKSKVKSSLMFNMTSHEANLLPITKFHPSWEVWN